MASPTSYRPVAATYNAEVSTDRSTLPVTERVLALDVLRGIAVGGILVANVIVFFGLTFLSRAQVAALATASADHPALWFEHVFVDQKFYSIFSLLFGIEFGSHLTRGG